MIDWLRREQPTLEIELGEQTLPIVLRRLKNAKRLTLRLAPDGSEVRVTLPKWARSDEAIAFANSRTEWLETQLARIPQRAAPQPGGQLLHCGSPLTIAWDADAPRKPRREEDIITVGGPQDALEKRLQSWLEREALALFEADTREYCEKAKLAAVPVALSRAQKRWGSCSDRHRIRLNWRLVQAPNWVRRSVVAHEVTHLVHFDHSPAFHAMLGNLYEGDIKAADRWLKENGRSLYASFG